MTGRQAVFSYFYFPKVKNEKHKIQNMILKKSFLKTLSIVIIIAFFSNTNVFAQEQKYYPGPDTLVQKKLDQWQYLEFGLLTHWGAYSQRSIVGIWSICPEDVGLATVARAQQGAENYFEYVKNYEGLKKTFNPAKFNPEEWAAAAKDAGMKYMIFTTKHHVKIETNRCRC